MTDEEFREVFRIHNKLVSELTSRLNNLTAYIMQKEEGKKDEADKHNSVQ